MHVHIAPLVSVKVIQGRRRALNAVPVNSMTMLVRFVADYVSIRRTLMAKEETRVVSIARSGGRLQKAVRNVIRVMPAHLAKRKVFVQHVQLGSFKIPKVKKNAVAFVLRLEKYPTMKARGVNCHRGVPAKWANI